MVNKMENGIFFTNIWLDETLVELKITAINKDLKFSNKIYISSSNIMQIAEELTDFKRNIYGGLIDIQMGKFGQEYANGAFWGRLHFQSRGQICITLKMESDYYEFGKKYISDEVILHLTTEPALLDEFISTLLKLHEKVGSTSILKCLVD